jgi:hypothetical protein
MARNARNTGVDFRKEFEGAPETGSTDVDAVIRYP